MTDAITPVILGILNSRENRFPVCDARCHYAVNACALSPRYRGRPIPGRLRTSGRMGCEFRAAKAGAAIRVFVVCFSQSSSISDPCFPSAAASVDQLSKRLHPHFFPRQRFCSELIYRTVARQLGDWSCRGKFWTIFFMENISVTPNQVYCFPGDGEFHEGGARKLVLSDLP